MTLSALVHALSGISPERALRPYYEPPLHRRNLEGLNCSS